MRNPYMRSSIVLAILITSAAAGAEVTPTPLKADAPAHVRSYFAKADELRKQYLEALPKFIAGARAELGRARARKDKREIEQLTKAIQRRGEEQRTLAAGSFTRPVMLGGPLRVGAIGVIEGDVEIFQVSGTDSALANIWLPESDHAFREAATPRMIRTIGSPHKLVLLRHSTDGWADGERKSFNGFWHVVETKTYGTAIGGSNTVFVLEPIDLEQWIERKAP
jgi:hypothetical protein